MFRQPTLESLGMLALQPDPPKAGAPPAPEAAGDVPPPVDPAPNAWGIAEDGFGLLLGPVLEGELEGVQTGEPVTRYTFTNKHGLSVQVINYGVTVTSVVVPDRNGVFDDIALGFDDFQDYLRHADYFLGSTVGRVANVVSKGRFQLDGRVFELSKDEEGVHRHGGVKGFARVLWRSSIVDDHVVFTHLSADGEEGYPGNVMVTIKMWLGDDNALHTRVEASTDRPSPLDVGNHTCFNLAGHMHGPSEIGNHVVTLNADKWLCVDDNGLPTGEMKHVGCTLMDLRVHRVLGRLTALAPGGGFDHTFVVNGARQDGVRFVARMLHPRSGRVLELFSDQPAVHLYTGQRLGYPVEDAVEEEALEAASLENQAPEEPVMADVEPEEAAQEPEPEPEPVVEAVPDAEGEPPAEGGEELDDVASVDLEELALTEEPESEPKKVGMLGKGGALYEKNGCFSLTTQAFTDAVNKRQFPEIVLRPGETYVRTTVLKFAVCVKAKKCAAEAMENSPPEPEPEPLVASEPGSRRHSGDSRRSGDDPPYPAFEEDSQRLKEAEEAEEDEVAVEVGEVEPVAVAE